MASNDNDPDAEYALSRLLQRGTVVKYQKEFEILVSRVTGKYESLPASIYTFAFKPTLIRALLWSNPTTLGEAFALARLAEAQVQHLEEITFHKSNKVEETKARFEAIAEKEQNIKEKVDTTLSLPSDEASPVVKGPLDASVDTLLFLRSEDPNFKIQENGVKYVRALNVVPLEVVFTGPVDEVSSVIEDVFEIDESNVEGGNSHSTYSSYHLEDKVDFERVGNITPWAAKVERRKIVNCYVQGSGRRKRKKELDKGLNGSHTFLPSQPQTYHTVIMVKMVSYEAFACPYGAGDVVLRESYKPKTREKRVYLLVGSPGASTNPIYSPGSSSTPIYSPGSSTPPRYSPGALTPQSYSPRTLRNAECSNCKHLLDKITVLEATVDMYMHPEQHTVNSAALFHEVYNNMKKLDLE
ncbi:hypothetical protein Tco_0788991 [Tanacetum coccineum]